MTKTYLLAGLALLLSGCEAATASVLAPVTGTYSLTQVNGAALPYHFVNHGTYARIESGTLTVSDGGWAQRMSIALVSGGPMTAEVSGTWTPAGDRAYDFTTVNYKLRAEVSDSSLRYSRDGADYVWTRR